MRLTSVVDFVRNKKLPLTIVVLSALSLLVLVPRQPDIEKLQALMERGNYPAAREGAMQVLARTPEAHSIRDMLVKICLVEGNFHEALEQLLFLADSGWDTRPREFEFNAAIPALEPDAGENLLALVIAALDGHPQWAWLREFGLKILVQGDSLSLIPLYLGKLNPEDYISYEDLISQAWRKTLDSGQRAIAWQATVAMDNLQQIEEINYWYSWQEDYFPPRFLFRAQILLSWLDQDAAELVALQQSQPLDPILAAGRGSVDLGWLLEWEGNNPIEDEYAGVYSYIKAQVIGRADQVEKRHLANITPRHLLKSVDISNRPKLQVVMAYIDENFPGTGDTELLRQALAAPEPPAPVWTVEGYSHGELTGDGGLVLSEYSPDFGTTYRYQNPKTGDEYVLPQGNYYWSPDGSKVAIIPWWGEYKLETYTSKGELLTRLGGIANIEQVGWQDANSLWIVRPKLVPQVGNVKVLTNYDLGTGSVQELPDMPKLSREGIFFFGPRGRVAWRDGYTIGVYQGGQVFTLKFDHYAEVLSWQPRAQGLIINLDNGYYFYQPGGIPQELDLPALGSPVIAWLSKDEFTWEFFMAGQTMLGVYNLKTGAVAMTGIVNPIDVVGNLVLARGSNNLYLYDLGELD